MFSKVLVIVFGGVELFIPFFSFSVFSNTLNKNYLCKCFFKEDENCTINIQ